MQLLSLSAQPVDVELSSQFPAWKASANTLWVTEVLQERGSWKLRLKPKERAPLSRFSCSQLIFMTKLQPPTSALTWTGYVGIPLCLLHLMYCDPDVFWPVVTTLGRKAFFTSLCLRSVVTFLWNATSLWGITHTHTHGLPHRPSVLHQKEKLHINEPSRKPPQTKHWSGRN